MSSQTKALGADFIGNEEATEDKLREAEITIGWELPADYRSFLVKSNGGNGFIGNTYLILWAIEELCRFNKEYRVNNYTPGLILFGSTGGGEAYAFDTRKKPSFILRIPFVGMDFQYGTPIANNFDELTSKLVSDGQNRKEKNNRTNETFGMEIFDIKPIILGGDPKDPKNKTLLNREKHIEIVNYWNNIIHDLKREKA